MNRKCIELIFFTYLHFFVHGLRRKSPPDSTLYDALRRSTPSGPPGLCRKNCSLFFVLGPLESPAWLAALGWWRSGPLGSILMHFGGSVWVTRLASSCDLVRPHSTSFDLVRPRSTSFDLIRPHSTSFDFIRPHSTSCDLVRPRATSCDLVRPRSTSFDLIWRHSTSFDLARPRPTSCDLL